MDLARNGERTIVSPSSNPSDYGFTYSTAREQPPPEVGWNEKARESSSVNLYSENVVQEGDTTEQVDRESIANLSTTRKQWETIFSSAQQEEKPSKKKTTPKWEVRLPTKGRGLAPSSTDSRHNLSESSNQPVESKAEVMESGPRDTESAIEYEIRLAREREEMLRREQEERLKQPKSHGQTIIASYEEVSAESEAYQPAFHELAEADRGPDLWSGRDRNGIADAYDQDEELVEEIDPNESIIEREIRLQRQREAELLKQRQLSTPRQQKTQNSQVQDNLQGPAPHSPVVQEAVQQSFHSHQEEVIADINHNEVADIAYEDAIAGAHHSGESIIARELRELKEREEEMKRMRMSFQNTQIQQKDKNSSEQPIAKSNTTNVASAPPPSQHAPPHISVQGTWQHDVSPFVSQKRRESVDSSSNHSGGGGTSRNVKVRPISDGNDNNEPEEKPDYFKKQETPIEREMRLARERENELRRMKGLPEIVERKEDDFYASVNTGPHSSSTSGAHSYRGSNQNNQSFMKKYGASRLQQEMNAQKQREMALRNEGKIISTSEDHIQPFKYIEITGSDRVDGSEKRNFTTKRSSITSPESSVSQTPRDLPSPSAPSAPKPQSSQKIATPGGQLFSYKEFRQTAESKIEKELREMREREEELRQQRASKSAETPR